MDRTHGDAAQWQRLSAAVLARDQFRCRMGGTRCQVTATEVAVLGAPGPTGRPAMADLRASCQRCLRAARRGELVTRRPRGWIIDSRSLGTRPFQPLPSGQHAQPRPPRLVAHVDLASCTWSGPAPVDEPRRGPSDG